MSGQVGQVDMFGPPPKSPADELRAKGVALHRKADRCHDSFDRRGKLRVEAFEFLRDAHDIDGRGLYGDG